MGARAMSHTRPMAHPDWPLFDLRVRTPRLELRPPSDDDIEALAELAAQGVHEPDFMPFENPWTDAPERELRRSAMQFYWRQRAEWLPESWHLPLAVIDDGVVVGTQGVQAVNFATVRSVETGSWIGRAHQGHGIGKEMRAAVLHLAFAGLEAIDAHSGAYHDNHASIGVSRSLGYLDNGVRRRRRRDRGDLQLLFRMPREVWTQRRRDDIDIEGLAPCLPMFGAGPQTPSHTPSSSMNASVAPLHS
ncbi:MAG: GNAT family N-acetyltransferase [Actinomycetota bacterium]